MRLHRFFISGKELETGTEVTVFSTDLLHQWRNVFRYNVGSLVLLFDESGFEALCQIELLTIMKASLQVLERKPSPVKPKKEITLFQALIKKNRIEWIFEKGTELGVSHFQPILTGRSQKKDINLERLKAIVKEAAEQSGRGVLPDIGEVLGIEACLGSINIPAVVLHGPGEKKSLRAISETLGEKFGIFIGPEGGWSDRELKLFEDKNIPTFSLGAATFRAETAAIAVLALFLVD